MISVTEKVVATFILTVPALLVLFSRGRQSPDTPGLIASLYAVIDWPLVRRACFRDDGSWRPLTKALLLGAFGVSLICVWVA